MSLDSVLGTASSGLASINAQLGVVSQNVANASTPGYAREVVGLSDLTAGGIGYGVRTGPATRAVDNALTAALNEQNASIAAAQVRSNALTNIDAAQGTTGAGNGLASRVGALQDAFTTLGADPSNQAQQANLVTAAGTLVTGIQTQAAAYTSERQAAQDGLVNDVTALNSAVSAIGTLSAQIVAAQGQGKSTADLEAQRATQEQTAAQLGGLQFLPNANGDVTAVIGASVVNTQAATGPFSIASGTLQTGTTAPPLLLSGADITSQVSGSNGGSIGARLQLRDTDLPQYQAGLDEFTATLATRLYNQGLSLFTDPAGNPPVTGGSPVQAGYIGFSTDVTVNPAVIKTPGLVRDGTQAIAPGTGGAAGFTPNPATGPAGFETLITNVLTYGFGADAQSGVTQPVPNTTGLGASGTINLPYRAGQTLGSFAADLAGAQSQASGKAQNNLTSGQALQSALQTKLSSETGVSVDAELSHMVELQNAYGANAKIISAAQTMWTALLDSVRT